MNLAKGQFGFECDLDLLRVLWQGRKYHYKSNGRTNGQPCYSQLCQVLEILTY